MLADSREHITQFRGVCIKPNAAEIAKAMNVPDPEFAVRRLAERSGCETQAVAGYPFEGLCDPVGAGDCASAAIATAVAAGATKAQGAAYGCLCASVTVRQIGTTGTAQPEQVRARWREVGGD